MSLKTRFSLEPVAGAQQRKQSGFEKKNSTARITIAVTTVGTETTATVRQTDTTP